jgi:hypothetical protein
VAELITLCMETTEGICKEQNGWQLIQALYLAKRYRTFPKPEYSRSIKQELVELKFLLRLRFSEPSWKTMRVIFNKYSGASLFILPIVKRIVDDRDSSRLSGCRIISQLIRSWMLLAKLVHPRNHENYLSPSPDFFFNDQLTKSFNNYLSI